MGGGGFSMEAENPLLDDFLLSLARRQPARVCFVPIASADSANYITRFYRAFTGRCVPTDLTLFDSTLPRRPARTANLLALPEANAYRVELIGQQAVETRLPARFLGAQ
jgi:Peptidase family S51